MSREHAYAYESGYQDGLRAAGTEKAALELRIDELCQENEQLRQRNAKLRELVGNYASMTRYLLARQPMLFAYKAKELQELDEKRQELGIEVPA